MIFEREKYLDELIAGRGKSSRLSTCLRQRRNSKSDAHYCQSMTTSVRLTLLAMIFTARRTNSEYS